MDLSALLGMLGGMGQQAPQQAPQTADGAGYGLGSPVVTGQAGNASYAPSAGAQNPSALMQLLQGAGGVAALQNGGAMTTALQGANMQNMQNPQSLAAMIGKLLLQQQQQPVTQMPFTSAGSLQGLQMQRQPRMSM